MGKLGGHIQTLRKQLGLSQTQLAEKVGISYAQISRYETENAQPPAEVLSKIAEVLNTSVDFIIHGDSSDKATASLNDVKLLNYFKEINSLPDGEKGTILKVISALIRDYKTQKAYAS